MRLPGPLSLVYLGYLLGFLPWMALRSARLLRARSDGTAARALPSRAAIWINTLVAELLTLGLAWMAGREFGFAIFALPPQGAREILAAIAALGLHFLVRAALRATRSDAERRKLAVYKMAPRTALEWCFWSATVLLASVAEEAAYRGVGMSILWYSLGNPWAAALLCAVAFALAHAIQGWKSGLAIFSMALIMHGLVAVTGSLVPAMIVHALYDLAAGYRISRDAARFEQAAPAAP